MTKHGVLWVIVMVHGSFAYPVVDLMAQNEAAARNIEEIIDLFSKRSKELQGSEKDLHDLRESVRQKKEEFLKRERALEMLEDDIRTRDLASKRLEADIVVRDRELKEKELLVSQLQEELGSLESILQDKEKKLTAQEHEVCVWNCSHFPP